MSSTTLARPDAFLDASSDWQELPVRSRSPRASGSKSKIRFSSSPRDYEMPDAVMAEEPDEMHRDVAMEIARTWED